MARMRHEYGLYNVLAIWCGLIEQNFNKEQNGSKKFTNWKLGRY